jgi:hypothetical protein
MKEISSNGISSNGIYVDTHTKGLKEIASIFDNYMKGMDAMSNKAYDDIDSEEKK